MEKYSIIKLIRYKYGLDGTFGEWVFPDGSRLFSVERAWKGNQRSVSCIPEGLYVLRKRKSPVVSRVTNGRYTEGWEVTNVPNRSFIMVHPGNWPSNFNGCIGVGQENRPLQHPTQGMIDAVTSSQAAFDTLMSKLEEKDKWFLDIQGYTPEY